MNRFFGLRFGDEFDEVSDDNLSSLAAGRSFRDSGHELADVIDELRKAIALFNPSKHGKGKLPWSLSYFEKGIRKALRARVAHDALENNEIPLLSPIEGGASTKAGKAGTPEPIGAVLGDLKRFGAR